MDRSGQHDTIMEYTWKHFPVWLVMSLPFPFDMAP